MASINSSRHSHSILMNPCRVSPAGFFQRKMRFTIFRAWWNRSFRVDRSEQAQSDAATASNRGFQRLP
jgi:hypothetical protein